MPKPEDGSSVPVDSNKPNGRPLGYRGITLGDLATASFVLCAISGAFLAAAFDPHDAFRSIAEWLLVNPGAVFLRNLHYWTAQVFLVTTLLHLWDHLRIATERRPSRGVWLRLVLSLPVLAFLMLSGFLLRGDSDAQQARLIFGEIIQRLPLLGTSLASLLIGRDDQLHVIYVQHAATATIIVWLIIIEHVRRLWPKAGALALVALALGGLSLALSPGLHDGLDLRMKGPWYFLGLQEILHWTNRPLGVVAVGCAGLVLLWLLPRLAERWARRAKIGLAVVLVVYAALCAVGLFLRAENWAWRFNWPGTGSNLHPGSIVSSGSPAVSIPKRLPVVLGRVEGCLVCHNQIQGLSNSHRPESFGCAVCHGGDPLTLEKTRAHAGMILVPGNLADAPRTCGTAGCHPSIVSRIERSIMTTFAGAIAADRLGFGETNHTTPPPHVRELGHTAADSHFRQLCASCHLGQDKVTWGPIGEESRGGGCNACHLVYSPAATESLARYEALPLNQRPDIPQVHPALSLRTDNSSCFGCHSRSGRISTNYEGWHELRTAPTPAELKAAGPGQFRRLDDERVFTRVVPDVHHEAGMACIDCHTANEVMGRGEVVARKSDQSTLRCEDCHTQTLTTMPAATIDPETSRILALRQITLPPGRMLGRTAAGDALINVLVAPDGTGQLQHKGSGKLSPMHAPLPVCAVGAGHERLSCSSCHTAWAPRCADCHTSFDPKAEGFDHLTQRFTQGAWTESSRPFAATLPTLGIQLDAAHPAGVVDTFVPGMIMEVDRNQDEGSPSNPIFRRWYAHTVAHTIRRESRSCRSCHNDPVALGYGQGTLRYEITGSTGHWRFTPVLALSLADGLPLDAWIGFLQTRTGVVSTRPDVRPFTAEEQRRILKVGACLTCHAETDPIMQQAIGDFAGAINRRSIHCILPDDS